MRGNEVSIMKITDSSGDTIQAVRAGSANPMNLPSVTIDKGYAGGGVIALTNKDNQNAVIIGIGGYVVP